MYCKITNAPEAGGHNAARNIDLRGVLRITNAPVDQGGQVVPHYLQYAECTVRAPTQMHHFTRASR